MSETETSDGPEQAAVVQADVAPAAEHDAAGAPGSVDDGAAPPTTGIARLNERVHEWLPIAIVAVSIFAAVMGWLASVADEHATHSDELGRQDFVSEQSALLSDVQQVDSDLSQFGTYEQYSLLGQQLLADGQKVGGSDGQALARDGQGDIDVARTIGGELSSLAYSPATPENYYNSSVQSGVLQPNGTYRPRNPPNASDSLAFEQSYDVNLVNLAPSLLFAQAKAQRETGVQLVGVAALFIAALVFFTFAALSNGLQPLWFSACGLPISLVAVILFAIVEFT
jgi:hypothetical protein